MERNNQPSVASSGGHKLELARCPRCNALCVNGHDVDCQIFCAKCGQSFIPKSYIEMSDEEYKEMTQKAAQKHQRSGWIAYTIDKIK